MSTSAQFDRSRRHERTRRRRPYKPRIEVGILGATGAVGQQFASLLAAHPWFRATWLAASGRSVGKRYSELAWRLPVACPSYIAEIPVETVKAGRGPKLIFSALDPSVAGEVEEEFAAAGHWVVSNARNHRMDSLVPLLVPEVNPGHLGLISQQQKSRDWSGAIATNPNCSTVFLAMTLAALRPLRPRRVLVTTLQALSGAGYPGVSSLDATANIVPFIGGEEEKIECETRKILGSLANNSVTPAPFVISAQATRVPVVYGHTETISVECEEAASPEDILAAFRAFSGEPQRLHLPSAPAQPIICHDDFDRPQPRLDVEKFGGMAVQVGRVRSCPVLGNKFVLLGHNTIRGAAGGTLLIAELMHALGMLG
ncbi:MAG: aspartate-semialdehyde dehydrogenase [Candidatus Acidiferrales bacterium]